MPAEGLSNPPLTSLSTLAVTQLGLSSSPLPLLLSPAVTESGVVSSSSLPPLPTPAITAHIPPARQLAKITSQTILGTFTPSLQLRFHGNFMPLMAAGDSLTDV